MATETQFIDRVRRKIGDFIEPRVFDKGFYTDALAFGLSKLSFDFDESYTTVESVPLEKEFLLVKLATIEMLFLMASKILEKGQTDSADGLDVTTLKVPDLEIATPNENSSDISEAYLSLAKALQKEYDGELKQVGGTATAAQIQTGYLNAFSLRNGGLANRRLDPGLPAVTLGATVAGNVVSLSWSKLYHPDFVSYEIHRSDDGFDTSDSVIGTVYDNHVSEFVDSGLSLGTYSYRVFTTNPNCIKIPSNTLEITVI